MFGTASPLLALTLALALPQDQKEPPAQEGEVKVTPLEKKEAKALLSELRKELSHKEPRVRKEAVERLAAYRSEEFVKPLTGFLKDKDAQVKLAAIHALGNQPFDKAQSALLKLLVHPKNKDNEEMALSVLEALSRCGWGKRGYQTLRDHFDRGSNKVKREIIKTFAAQKEKRAFSLFVDHLDEPKPASVNSASNPPASYWQARWKEWTYLKTYVQKGVKALTEQDFKTKKEALEWVATKEAKKAGFVYKSGS